MGNVSGANEHCGKGCNEAQRGMANIITLFKQPDSIRSPLAADSQQITPSDRVAEIANLQDGAGLIVLLCAFAIVAFVGYKVVRRRQMTLAQSPLLG